MALEGCQLSVLGNIGIKSMAMAEGWERKKSEVFKCVDLLLEEIIV